MSKRVKRLSIAIAILCVLSMNIGCSSKNNETEKTDANQPTEENNAESLIATTNAKGIVEYAFEKPIIDGEIDECWDNIGRLFTDNNYREYNLNPSRRMSKGSVSLMWDEDNLYLLGVVEDVDIVEKDMISFWISETYIKPDEENLIAYSDNPSEGMYFILTNPNGLNPIYTDGEGKPIDFPKTIEGYECKATVTGQKYVVEIKMPIQSDIEWESGHLMGFDVSVDTYFSGEDKRGEDQKGSMYCNWNGEGAYWSYANCLGSLVLVK